MSIERSEGIEIACPGCAGPAIFGPSNRWRPFCSERCKRIDLGAWASDQYRIAGNDDAPADPDAPSGDERPDPH
jgi:endogenous inhibitor of DNA gyrase (YacG/DUF329 family)